MNPFVTVTGNDAIAARITLQTAEANYVDGQLTLRVRSVGNPALPHGTRLIVHGGFAAIHPALAGTELEYAVTWKPAGE